MIEKLIAPITNLLRYQKKYIFLTLLFVIGFTLIMFPYNDLSDLITQQVAQKSNNQVFLKFHNMSLGILPPSVKMEQVSVDTPFLPTIHAGALSLAPSIPALLRFSPGVEARIYKVFGGNIFLEYAQGKPLNEQTRLQKITLDLKKVELKPLTQFLALPLSIQGLVDTDIRAEFDPGFAGQPDGNVELEIKNFVLPQTTIPTVVGPFILPDIKMSRVRVVGEIKNSIFKIESGDLGVDGDSIAGKITGSIGMRLVRMGNAVAPEWSNYEFLVDLSLNQTIESTLGPFLGVLNIDKYKTRTGTGSRYTFRISGANFRTFPPVVSPAQ